LNQKWTSKSKNVPVFIPLQSNSVFLARKSYFSREPLHYFYRFPIISPRTNTRLRVSNAAVSVKSQNGEIKTQNGVAMPTKKSEN